MRNNIDNCFEACKSTGTRCLEGDEELTTSKIVTNSVEVFFDFLLDNAEKESGGSNERIESPSQWFIRGWRENYDEIMEDIRERKAKKLYTECYESLRHKVIHEAKGTSLTTDRLNRKSKPLLTSYDELYLLGDRCGANDNKNNNSSSDSFVQSDDDDLTSVRKEKKGNKRKENKKDRKKTHELPNSLTGITFNTGNVLPRIRQHLGPSDEGEHMSNAEYDAAFKDTTGMVDKFTGPRITNSSQPKSIFQEVQEVGKTEEQKFFEKDQKILSTLIKKINKESDKKFCPMVLEDEAPAAVRLTKESDIDVIKLRGQFSKVSMLPQIGQTKPKDDIGKMMKVEEHTMEITDKKPHYSKDFIIDMERLKKERVQEEINKIERQVQCSNPHGDCNMENMPTFVPQPPQGKPNAPRRGRRFKPSSQIPDENLFYVPHAPKWDGEL